MTESRRSRHGRPEPLAERPATPPWVFAVLGLVGALVLAALWVAGSGGPQVGAPPAQQPGQQAPADPLEPPGVWPPPELLPPADTLPEPEPDLEPEPAGSGPARAGIRGPTEVVSVTRVVDGDTLVLADDRRVRLIGINTPEHGEAYFTEARDTLRGLVAGQEVTLEFDAEATDQYGRLLAYVHRGDTFVNGEMIRHGLAYCFTWEPNVAHREDLLALQLVARQAAVGLWSQAPEPAASYQADARTHRFHRDDCRRVPRRDPSRLTSYASRDEALDRGFTPCSDCRP